MSSDAPLTDRDRKLLAKIDDQIDAADSPTDYDRLARELRDQLREHKALLREHEQRLDHHEDRFDRLEDGGLETETDDAAATIDRYANIPRDERAELLDTSEHIAATIHGNWDQIAWTLGGGRNAHGDRATQRVGVDTASRATVQYSPSKLKHRVTTILDEDFQSVQLYRGMKRLAKLTGGEERVNVDGRVHISGGTYEYREQSSPDNTDGQITRVLWRGDDR